MKSNAANFCGLDLQKDKLSFVQFSTEENAVTLIALQPVSSGNSNDAWQIWLNGLSAMKGRLRYFTGDVVCGLPSEYAQIRHCLIDEEEKNWQEAVEWEIGQQILGTRDEYVIDYEQTTGGGGTKKYLAVAYRKALVDRTVGILRKVKLTPRIIDLDIFGLINAFEVNYPEKRDDVSLLVHTEQTLTKLVLTGDGTFLDFYSFEHPDEGTFPGVLGEKIEGFLSSLQKTGDGAKERVYLAGSYFSPEARRKPILEKIPGAEMLDPFRKVPCQVAIDEQHLREYSTKLVVAVGLALRGKE